MRKLSCQRLSVCILGTLLVTNSINCFPDPSELDKKEDTNLVDGQTINDVGPSLNDIERPTDLASNQDGGQNEVVPNETIDDIVEDTTDTVIADINDVTANINDTTTPLDTDPIFDGEVSIEPDVTDATITPPRCPGGSIVFTWGTNSNQRIEIAEAVTVSEYFETERRSKTYECPDDFFNVQGLEPRWSTPISVSWVQPLGTSSQWRDFAVAFNAAFNLWDYLTQNGQANPDLNRLPSGTLSIISSTGASRALPLRSIRPQPLQSFSTENPPYERLILEAGESPNHGFILDVSGIGEGIRVDLVSLRIDPNTTFGPEIQYPHQWSNSYYARTSGQLRIFNPCATLGERAFFGRRDLWLWYASGNAERKSMSLRFMGPSGQELKSYNIFDAFPSVYEPQFDSCGTSSQQEIMIFDFSLIENG